MTPTTATVSPLRQRMLDDMRMRNLAPKTQSAYIRAVCSLTRYLRRSPDTAIPEDLRLFQLHMVDEGISAVSLNATLTGLKFFFDVTLERSDAMARTRPVRTPRRLPVVLSQEEISRLIAATPSIKYQTALSVAYGAGLRVGEIVRLRVADIDSQRMALRVDQGKGLKDRYAMLPPLLLQRLRAWWKAAHAEGAIRADGWLFPGRDPVLPMSARQLNRVVHEAAEVAGIGKRVAMHTLRHSFATHLLEQKVDIRVIQVLLGHKKLETTSMYAQVATEVLRAVISPIETLPPR